MVFSIISLVVFYFWQVLMILTVSVIGYALQWAILFLIELVGITQLEIKTILCFLVSITMIFLTCGGDDILSKGFVISPAIGLLLVPQVLSKAGHQYWKDSFNAFTYFTYACFGYWDSSGVCRALFELDKNVKDFNDVQVANDEKSKSDDTTNEEILEIEESYYSNVISTTIGTRILLLMIFKIFTPIALFIRATCPFPILVYDKKLLTRLISH